MASTIMALFSFDVWDVAWQTPFHKRPVRIRRIMRNATTPRPIEMLRDRDAYGRAYSCDRLGERRDPEAVPALFA